MSPHKIRCHDSSISMDSAQKKPEDFNQTIAIDVSVKIKPYNLREKLVKPMSIHCLSV